MRPRVPLPGSTWSDMALAYLLLLALGIIRASASPTSSDPSRTSSRQLATMSTTPIEVDATYFKLQQYGAPPAPFVKIADNANPSVTLQPYLPWRGSLIVVRLQERRPKMFQRLARWIGGRMVDRMLVSRVRPTLPKENRTWDGRVLPLAPDVEGEDVCPLVDVHMRRGRAFPLSGGRTVAGVEYDPNLAELLDDSAANIHYTDAPTIRQWRVHSDALRVFAKQQQVDIGLRPAQFELHVTRIVFGFGARCITGSRQSTVFGVPEEEDEAQLAAPSLRFVFYPATWGFYQKNPETINTLPVQILPLQDASDTMLETLGYQSLPQSLRETLLGVFYSKMAEGNYDVPYIMPYISTRNTHPSPLIREQLFRIHSQLTKELGCVARSMEWRNHAAAVLRTQLSEDFEQMYVQAVKHSSEVLASQRLAFGNAIAEARQMIVSASERVQWSPNTPELLKAVQTLDCEGIKAELSRSSTPPVEEIMAWQSREDPSVKQQRVDIEYGRPTTSLVASIRFDDPEQWQPIIIAALRGQEPAVIRELATMLPESFTKDDRDRAIVFLLLHGNDAVPTQLTRQPFFHQEETAKVIQILVAYILRCGMAPGHSNQIFDVLNFCISIIGSHTTEDVTDITSYSRSVSIRFDGEIDLAKSVERILDARDIPSVNYLELWRHSITSALIDGHFWRVSAFLNRLDFHFGILNTAKSMFEAVLETKGKLAGHELQGLLKLYDQTQFFEAMAVLAARSPSPDRAAVIQWIFANSALSQQQNKQVSSQLLRALFTIDMPDLDAVVQPLLEATPELVEMIQELHDLRIIGAIASASSAAHLAPLLKRYSVEQQANEMHAKFHTIMEHMPLDENAAEVLVELLSSAVESRQSSAVANYLQHPGHFSPDNDRIKQVFKGLVKDCVNQRDISREISDAVDTFMQKWGTRWFGELFSIDQLWWLVYLHTQNFNAMPSWQHLLNGELNHPVFRHMQSGYVHGPDKIILALVRNAPLDGKTPDNFVTLSNQYDHRLSAKNDGNLEFAWGDKFSKDNAAFQLIRTGNDGMIDGLGGLQIYNQGRYAVVSADAKLKFEHAKSGANFSLLYAGDGSYFLKHDESYFSADGRFIDSRDNAIRLHIKTFIHASTIDPPQRARTYQKITWYWGDHFTAHFTGYRFRQQIRTTRWKWAGWRMFVVQSTMWPLGSFAMSSYDRGAWHWTNFGGMDSGLSAEKHNPSDPVQLFFPIRSREDGDSGFLNFLLVNCVDNRRESKCSSNKIGMQSSVERPYDWVYRSDAFGITSMLVEPKVQY